MKNIKYVDDFIYVKNVINKKTCNSLLKKIKKKETKKHSWFEYEKNKTFSREEKEPDVSDANTEELSILYPLIGKALDEYEKKFTINFGMVSRMTTIRFNYYNKNSDMRLHIDHIHSIFDGKEKGIPILSCVGLLNDDFEGGEFILRDKKINLKKGDVIIFPSCFIYYHKVNTVTKGTRYSFVCWGY